jgi:membrane-associated phospholipid phosphatase
MAVLFLIIKVILFYLIFVGCFIAAKIFVSQKEKKEYILFVELMFGISFLMSFFWVLRLELVLLGKL